MLRRCFEFVHDRRGVCARRSSPVLLLIDQELALHGRHQYLAAVSRQRHARQSHAQAVQRVAFGPVFRGEDLHAPVVRGGAEERGVFFVEVHVGNELDVCGNRRQTGAHAQIPDPHSVVLRARREVVAVAVEVRAKHLLEVAGEWEHRRADADVPNHADGCEVAGVLCEQGLR